MVQVVGNHSFVQINQTSGGGAAEMADGSAWSWGHGVPTESTENGATDPFDEIFTTFLPSKAKPAIVEQPITKAWDPEVGNRWEDIILED